MRRVVLLIAAMPLLAQPARPPQPALGSRESPQGFRLREPGYRFPAEIKQALVQFVQPVPSLVKEYQSVYLDKRKFSTWLRGVLMTVRAQPARPARSEGSVLSSDLSKLSPDGGVILSTARTRPRRVVDPAAVDRYLDVLKAWAPD